jgi:DNA invertase Pin-like site-specific DNA recombinase
MKRAAIGYVRVSTDEQIKGYGLAAQEQAIRDYCKQEGLHLVDVARDEGLSGSNGLETRVGLAGALARLEVGGADSLIVSRLDRLARDLLTQETVLERLRQRGRDVISVAEPDVTSDDPTRVLVRQVLGAIAQYERGVIRGRMLAGKAVKAARGGYTGGRPRFGTRAENAALVTAVDESEAVDAIVELRRAGRSYRDVCAELDARGLKPRRADQWQPAVVRRIALREDRP